MKFGGGARLNPYLLPGKNRNAGVRRENLVGIGFHLCKQGLMQSRGSVEHVLQKKTQASSGYVSRFPNLL